MSVESWHTHFLLDHGFDTVEAVAGRLKTRMRQAVGIGRMWTTGYDSRFCFAVEAVGKRKRYIERHAGWRPLEA